MHTDVDIYIYIYIYIYTHTHTIYIPSSNIYQEGGVGVQKEGDNLMFSQGGVGLGC